MLAAVLGRNSFQATHAAPGALRRGLLAGAAWGIAMGALLTAVNAWDCGFVCIPDAVLTTAISVIAGGLTIGPLAAFGRRASST